MPTGPRTTTERTAQAAGPRRPPWWGEAAIVFSLLVLYDAAADWARVRIPVALAHGRWILDAEAGAGLDVEHRLNALLASARGLHAAAALYYDTAHAGVTVAALVVLYLRRPAAYRPLRNALVVENLLALLVFACWPVAPPRLLGGFVDIVGSSGTPGSWEASSTLSTHADQYAAMPSLHVAWALWSLAAVMAATRQRRWRVLVMLHVGVTVLVVLATGNHYVLDVCAGAVVAYLALRSTARAAPPPVAGPAVLIVSAGMGAGHDGVAYELARRLRGEGTRVDVVDYLRILPWGTGWIIRAVYSAQLRYFPASYEWLYEALDRARPVDRLARWIAGWGRPRLGRELRRGGYTLAIATYPLAGQALGQLRRRGRLRIPAVTFLTDMDVHGMWLDEGTDLYLAVYEGSAQAAARRTGRPAVGVGPVLPPRHAGPVTPGERAAARARHGIGADETVVLVVTGSWGVGEVVRTAAAITAAGAGRPVVLCGRNEVLRRHLAALPGVRAVGWTDDVRSLIAAADAVVHNAGGLSSLEGFAAGVPVVGHACLPGHGLRNAKAMADAGVAALAGDGDELVASLRRLARTEAGAAMAGRAHALFVADPTQDLLRLASAPQPLDQPARRSRLLLVPTRLVAALLVAPLTLVTLSFGISEAQERYEFGAAHVPKGAGPVLYAAALLDGREVAAPWTAGALSRAGVSAAIGSADAANRPDGVRALAATVSVLAAEVGSPGLRPGPLRAAITSPVRTVGAADGQARTPLVLLHPPNPLVLVASARVHALLGVAGAVLAPRDRASVRYHEQVLLDLRGLSRRQAVGQLDRLRTAAAAQGLQVVPWGQLWQLP